MGRKTRHTAVLSEGNANLEPIREIVSLAGDLSSMLQTKDDLTLHSSSNNKEAAAVEAARNPFTYHGPNTGPNPHKRLHQEFKSLSKEHRKRLVEEATAKTDLLARTVHLRFLPKGMLQSELAKLCGQCGEYLRVRICGNAKSTQNWIYGFVEFADKKGAAAMMQCSGMELPNGPGKPPLRLMCNAAKQAIVDRVFHDADPATNTTCIFGSGNFAHRTLKEAIDSYYNLKRKECSGNVQTSASHWPHVDSDRGGGKESNHENDTSSDNSERHPVLPPHRVEVPEGPQAVLRGVSFGGQTLCSHPHSDFESALNASSLQPQSHPSARLSFNSVSGTFQGSTSDAPCSPPFYSQTTTPALCFTQTRDDLCREMYGDHVVPCDGQFSPLLVGTGIHNACDTNGSVSCPLTRQEAVEQGQGILLKAMCYTDSLFNVVEKLNDAICWLLQLIAIVSPFIERGELTSTQHHTKVPTADGEDMDIVQRRLVQLYLSAQLLLSLLFSKKGNNEKALIAVHHIVTCCNGIKILKLQKPESPAPSSVLLSACRSAPENAETSIIACDPCDVVGSRGLLDVPLTDAKQAGGDDFAATINPLEHGFDLRSEINMEEAKSTSMNITMGISPSEGQDIFFEKWKKQEEQYQPEVSFQSFVLNVLITVGLAFEAVQPVVSRCVYVLAALRAKEVFGAVPAALEQTLNDGGVHCLRRVLFPQFPENAFIDQFFLLFERRDDPFSTGTEWLWSVLPPQHMVRWFPVGRL